MSGALVLAGGGARGAFEIGVWKALREIGFEFSVITGVSVGALNAAIIASDNYDAALNIWENISNQQVLDFEPNELYGSNGIDTKAVGTLLRDILKQGGIRSKGLEKIIRENLDEEKVRASDKAVGLIAVRKSDMRPLKLFIEDIEQGRLSQYLLASSALYPVFAPVKINGTEYIDGGYYDNFPIQMALERGAKQIVAVNLEAPGIYRKIKLPPGVTVTTITCRWNLGSMLVFDKNTAQTNISLGYLETMKAFDRLEGYKYSFNKGEFTLFADKNMPEIISLMRPLRLFIPPTEESMAVTARVLYRYIKKRGAQSRDFAEMCRASADIAAEIFGVSPTRIWTVEELNNELLDKYRSANREMQQTKDEILNERVSVGMLKNLPSYLGRDKIAALTVQIINDPVYARRLRRLHNMAMIFPTETIAALYVFAVGKQKG